MIARLWRTRIDPARGAEYDDFAARHSRPMFASLPGCLAAFFLGAGETRSVLTLWTGLAAIEALERSATYLETVARIEATGILIESRTTELLPVTGGTVDMGSLGAELVMPHPDESR